MRIYKAPLDDIRFIFETLDYEGRVASLADFADFDLETVMGMAKEMGRFGTRDALPLSKTADKQGTRWNPETFAVTTADGFPGLLKKFRDSGFAGISQPTEWGGQGGPTSLGLILGEISTATNKSFSIAR